MSEFIIKSVNCETGEEIEREMTDKEISELKKIQQEFQEKKNREQLEAENLRLKKLEVLQKIGLDEEELQIILS